MKRNVTTVCLVLAVTCCVALTSIGTQAVPPDGADSNSPDDKEAVQTVGLPSLEEARARARLLHETVHATLQIVHLRYYREDEALPLPARTLRSVFGEMDRRHNVKFRWLAVDGQAMNIDHKPQNDFEKNAAKALASGKEELEMVEKGVYRHAGRIRLSAECLKCHVPNRTSLEDRTAGLVITMPIKND